MPGTENTVRIKSEFIEKSIFTEIRSVFVDEVGNKAIAVSKDGVELTKTEKEIELKTVYTFSFFDDINTLYTKFITDCSGKQYKDDNMKNIQIKLSDNKTLVNVDNYNFDLLKDVIKPYNDILYIEFILPINLVNLNKYV